MAALFSVTLILTLTKSGDYFNMQLKMIYVGMFVVIMFCYFHPKQKLSLYVIYVCMYLFIYLFIYFIYFIYYLNLFYFMYYLNYFILLFFILFY